MRTGKEQKKINWAVVLLVLYIIFLIKVIIFKYPIEHMKAIVDGWQKDVILEGLSTANYKPFHTIRLYLKHYNTLGIIAFSNLYGNVLVFVPFGVLLPMVHKKSKNLLVLLLNTLFFVLGIEVFQLFSAFGAFDVDDILLNCLGAFLGGVLFFICEKTRPYCVKKDVKNL